MIKRIVRLTFHPDKVDQFKAIYNESKPYILESKGCTGVALYKDSKYANIMYTVSQWDSEEDLNAYRNTDFFSKTWQRTKALFCGLPQAFSLNDAESNPIDFFASTNLESDTAR